MPLIKFVSHSPRRLSAPLVALVATLCACQQQNAPLDRSAEDRPTVKAEQQVPEPAPTPAVATPEITLPEPEPEPLNLEIPADILGETSDTGFAMEERRYLPNLFNQPRRQGSRVSSELLFREGEKASLDTVAGAKITIEVPVN